MLGNKETFSVCFKNEIFDDQADHKALIGLFGN